MAEVNPKNGANWAGGEKIKREQSVRRRLQKELTSRKISILGGRGNAGGEKSLSQECWFVKIFCGDQRPARAS